MPQSFPLSGAEFAVGQLLVLNSNDAVPQVLLNTKLLEVGGNFEAIDVVGEDGETIVGWLTFARNGSDEPVLTYSRPSPTEADATEQTTIVLHGRGHDRSGFSVYGPEVVPDGRDVFSMMTTAIGIGAFVLAVVAVLGLFASCINGY